MGECSGFSNCCVDYAVPSSCKDDGQCTYTDVPTACNAHSDCSLTGERCVYDDGSDDADTTTVGECSDPTYTRVNPSVKLL